jgi:hypothetical protein
MPYKSMDSCINFCLDIGGIEADSQPTSIVIDIDAN